MTDYSKRELSSSMGGPEIARISSGGVGGGTLSWRSRDHHPSWWNTAMQLSNSLSSSAKELTSSLASKMDQVPTALAGFTLPWQPVSSSPYKEQAKSDQQQPSAALSREKLENLPWKPDASEEEEEERKASSELPTVPPPLGEQQLLPVLPGPCPLTAADLRSLSKVGESCRRTKRMPVDTTSCTTDCNDNDDIFFSSSCAAGASLLQAGGLSSVSQRFLLGDDAQLDSLRCNSMEHLPRLENRLFAKAIRHNAVSESTTPLSHHLNTDVKHVNEASLILSEACPTHSSAQQTPLPYPPEKKESTINTGQQGESQPETPISSRGTNFHQATIHKDDIFPGNTNKLSPIRLRKSSSSIISSEQQSQKLANSLLLFDSQHSRTLSKNPVLGGSMRVTRRDHADMQQQQMGSCVTVAASSLSSSASLPTTPRGGGEASLPTTPRGRGESRASRLFRRLRFGGGKRPFHGGGAAAAGGGVQVVDPRDLLLKCAKQDTPTPGVAIIKQGKKLDSKAAAVITKAGSATVDFTALHGGQHEGTSMEIRSEGNHRMLNNNTSQTTTQGQCSGGDADSTTTTTRKTFVKPHQQQQRKNSHWPFNKWKWTSRSRSKVVSEETNNMSAMIVNNSSRRSSFDTSQEFFAMSETMYEDASSESFSYERVGRFSSPQVKKSLSLEHMGGFFKHRRGSSLGSNREVAVSYQLLLPKHHVRCNDDIATTISDLKKLSSANQLEKSSHHGLEVDSSSSSAACQAEEENTAEVFLDCEGEFKFVKQRSLSMEEDLVVWESHTPAPPPPSLPQEQNLTIGEVAALCSSPLKFVFKCREIELFNKFLRSQKKRIISSSISSNSTLHLDNNNNNSDCFHIIRSGAECEVSSMVSALLMAWWMENTVLVPPPAMKKKTNKWHLVPVLSIPRKSMHKHKDAAWLFDACGVDARALLFSDEVELENLTKAGRVKTEDIGQDLLVTRNEVGSVCTLLAEQLQREADHLLQARYMKTLLLAGILLDTENLDFASIRDTDMATALLVGSGSLGRNGFYKQLTEVESDERVSKLVTQIYGEVPQSSRRSRGEEREADHEHSDKDSYFSSADGRHSHDQTSTSEASTSSSLDEDSPRLQTPPPALPTNISAPTRSAPARFHRLPSPSGVTRSVEANAVAQIREAAAGNQSLRVSSFTHGSSRHLKSGNSSGSSDSSPFSRLRKKLLYNA